MRIRKIWRSLTGYLVVQVKGPRLEGFLNACVREGLVLWNTVRVESGLMVVHIAPSAYRRMRMLCRSQGWRVQILRRGGLLFTVRRLGERRVLVVGGLMALAVWYALSAHIWFVAVEGTERVQPERVLAVAAQAGLAPGSPRSGLDLDVIQRELLLTLDDLVWAGVEVRGTRAVVRIAERRIADSESMGPGHVVAASDGVIERISAVRGTPVVGPGETVRAGQILISGLLEPGSPSYLARLEAGEVPYVRAAGVATALVWYEATVEAKVHGSPEAAQREARELALVQAQANLARGGGEQVSDPVVDTLVDEDIVVVRVLLPALEDIGTFRPVIP